MYIRNQEFLAGLLTNQQALLAVFRKLELAQSKASLLFSTSLFYVVCWLNWLVLTRYALFY